MVRRYYSSRTKPKKLTIEELYLRIQHLYLLFRDRDYFKGKARITKTDLPEEIKHKAALATGFQPFPITKWESYDITEDHIFDTIEFLYHHASEPCDWGPMTSDTGYNYYDYENYNAANGQLEFRNEANRFLCD